MCSVFQFSGNVLMEKKCVQFFRLPFFIISLLLMSLEGLDLRAYHTKALGNAEICYENPGKS